MGFIDIFRKPFGVLDKYLDKQGEELLKLNEVPPDSTTKKQTKKIKTRKLII
jgi:hypothetical protein